MILRDKLYIELYSSGNLSKSWAYTLSKASQPGVDKCSVYDFGQNLLENLQSLQKELKTKKYVPSPIRIVYVAKKSKGRRELAILTVKDRIVQRALYQIIAPTLDKDFENISYGYRCGYSTEKAIQQVVDFAKLGLFWVVDLDIKDFFPSIIPTRVMELIRSKIRSKGILRLLNSFLEQQSIAKASANKNSFKKIKENKTIGLLQGSILSPILANLYLDPFDKYLMGSKIRHVRFADDVVILAGSKEKAYSSLHIAKKKLEEYGLQLNHSKTKVVHLNQGFHFLGKWLIAKKHRKMRVQDQAKQKIFTKNGVDFFVCSPKEEKKS